MRYDISNQKAPEMPNLGKGTECIKFLLTQASEDMHEPLVPMLFPSLGAHISGAEFQYPDRSWKEPCGMMAQLVGSSGDNKGQLTTLAKDICRDFSQYDKAEEDKILEWQKQKQTEPDNKKKTIIRKVNLLACRTATSCVVVHPASASLQARNAASTICPC